MQERSPAFARNVHRIGRAPVLMGRKLPGVLLPPTGNLSDDETRRNRRFGRKSPFRQRWARRPKGSALKLAVAGITRPNVGVDRHAVALRREAYAHQHALRRNAAACPCRTTCYAPVNGWLPTRVSLPTRNTLAELLRERDNDALRPANVG
jgi:hypothetical protein